MLVLSRRVDETLVIGGNITVRVVSVDNGQVRLGIEAPRSVPVVRGELLEAVAAENREASVADQQNAQQALTALKALQHENKNV